MEEIIRETQGNSARRQNLKAKFALSHRSGILIEISDSRAIYHSLYLSHFLILMQ